MAHDKLLDQLKRLLEYSGQKVEDVSMTKDGATAIVYFNDRPHRIFIAPIKPIPKSLQEYGATFLIDPY